MGTCEKIGRTREALRQTCLALKGSWLEKLKVRANRSLAQKCELSQAMRADGRSRKKVNEISVTGAMKR